MVIQTKFNIDQEVVSLGRKGIIKSIDIEVRPKKTIIKYKVKIRGEWGDYTDRVKEENLA